MTPKETEWKNNPFISELVNFFPAAVFWKDTKGIFLGCNMHFAHLAGVKSPDEIIGKTDFDLPWGKIEAKKYRRDDEALMNSGVPQLNIEESITLSDNSQQYLLTSKTPLFSKSGKVIGIIGIFQDITEQKKIRVCSSKSQPSEKRIHS